MVGKSNENVFFYSDRRLEVRRIRDIQFEISRFDCTTACQRKSKPAYFLSEAPYSKCHERSDIR